VEYYNVWLILDPGQSAAVAYEAGTEKDKRADTK
jgi:hypothetical protein